MGAAMSDRGWHMTPEQAQEKARELLTAWSEQEGCTVASRYEGDRWDVLVDLIATALLAACQAQREKDAKICNEIHRILDY